MLFHRYQWFQLYQLSILLELKKPQVWYTEFDYICYYISMLKFDKFFYAKQTFLIFPEFLPVYDPTVLTLFISFQISSQQASLSSHILTPSLITTMIVQQTQIGNKKSLLAHLRRSSLVMYLAHDPVFRGWNLGRLLTHMIVHPT